jgi:hypothetical protein
MRRLAALAAAALALAGCGAVKDLFYAELEIPSVGITLPSQQFPASVADPSFWCAPALPDCIMTELTYDLGNQVDLLTDPNAEYEIRLTDLALALTANNAGTDDLRGVRSVSIEVFLPSAPADAVTVASYLRPSGATPTAIAVTGNANVDLAPFLDAGLIHVRVKMSYDAPTPAFTADVRSTFYLRVRLDYGRMV